MERGRGVEKVKEEINSISKVISKAEEKWMDQSFLGFIRIKQAT